MTREEIYNQCVQKIAKTNCLLMELATGTGKTRLSIMLMNHLLNSKWYKDKQNIKILLLVAKVVHKQTWKDEINKWGGISHPTAKIDIIMECYESLKKHQNETFDIVCLDEVHHVGSDLRLEQLATVHFGYMIGLSATIPRNLKSYLKYKYHSQTVSCDIVEAIENDILPEPTILLLPLELDNTRNTEEIVFNPNAKGPVVEGVYSDLFKLKRNRCKVIVHCTQKQKMIEMNKQILNEKNRYMRSRSKAVETIWLYHCGQRLEYLSNLKLPMIQQILNKLRNKRTITFCKTISQTETLGSNCIHSKNKNSADIYEKFNKKKINHITAVNILNENANLVDCKYAIFCNIVASEVMQVQRIGRSLRHKSPVLIIPYFKSTREEELVDKIVKDFNKDCIKTIKSIDEI